MKTQYLNVKQISISEGLTTRHVRRICVKLKDNHTKDIIHKDKNGQWQVHHLLLPKFKRDRSQKKKYKYSFTIDPIDKYKESELDIIMKFIVNSTVPEGTEVHYCIEPNETEGKNHIHGFTNYRSPKKLQGAVINLLPNVDYHYEEIYDLEGWKRYITKTNTEIKYIKKQ